MSDITWRVETPAKYLGAKVIVLPEEIAWDAMMEPNTDSPFRWSQRDDGITDYEGLEGTVIFTRPDLARATHARCMRQIHGMRTVAEVDDNYIGNPKQNIYLKKAGWNAVNRLDHMKSLASQDGLIVTTEWLRDRYHRACKKQFDYCPPIYVCRNHVDPETWPVPEPRKDKLRIGYMGSPQHVWDLKIAYPALAWAESQGHEVVVIGIDPEWERIQYTHIPWKKPKDFHRTALPIDIGIASIVYDDHTSGKSDIKPMEYLMSGAAPIVQNCPLYNQTFKHGETALLAGSPAEFLVQLQRLARDAGLRERIVEAGTQYIREERLMTKPANLAEWEAAING